MPRRKVVPVEELDIFAAEAARLKAEKEKAPRRRTVRKTMTDEEKAAKKERDELKKKAEAMRPTLILQAQGKADVNIGELVERAKATFTEANPNTMITELAFYIKPEESAAYYVVNGTPTGKVDF